VSVAGIPLLMENPFRDYAWGSRTALAEMQGRPVPSPGPEAELWMGAYAPCSSRVLPSGESLLARIQSDPAAELGAEVAARYSGRLPFLLKVLAVERPLSLQAHPSLDEAREGFARQEDAGLSAEAPERSYRDESHKPELLCALTPFDALCGFRQVAQTCALLDALAVPELEVVSAPLRDRGADGLQAAFSSLMGTAEHRRSDLVEAVAAACRRVLDAAGASGTGASGTGASGAGRAFAAELRWVLRLAEAYPADPGVVAALLLNLIQLHPGEALFVPAGTLHAYLSGVGVEIMASSDNVLRGGLTPKPVDVAELMRVLRFIERSPTVCHASGCAPDEQVFSAEAEEFSLSRLALEPGQQISLAGRRPQILLGVAGSATVTTSGGTVQLSRGGSVWVPAAAEHVQLTAAGSDDAAGGAGGGLFFRATTPSPGR
jgi:mannose-6-phosphate isomerase